jgi:Arc/MetJ-type ribon-helix-helix transcriptional regulator
VRGILVGTTTLKIAVSLPEPLVVQARKLVRKGRAESFSAYVAGALETRAKLEGLEDLLQEMLVETGGPLTAKERRAADEALGLVAARSAGRRKRGHA